MNKEELRKMILQEAAYINNLIKEKEQIEKQLQEITAYSTPFEEIEKNAAVEDEGVSDSTSLRNMKSMPKRLKDKHFKKEDEMEEASGVSISSQMGKPTNPQYNSRNKKGYVRKTLKEEDILRKEIRKQLYESYGLNEVPEVDTYIVKLKHDKEKEQ